tara:strand:- start:1586 stop:2020 length:435 start_codon:yes stop_codon:yes gene_type:complete
MKRGKELKLNLNPNYKIKLGTVDNKNPKTIYINLTAWGQLKKYDIDLNYDNVINKLRTKIKHKINSYNVDAFHNGKYIVDLDMRSSGIKPTKRSFMSCEITLFQRNITPVNNPTLVHTTSELINDVIKNCLDKSEHFTFYKTKN